MSVQMPQTSDELFRSYMKSPKLAIPTTLLLAVALAGIAWVWSAALQGEIAMWQGGIINGVLSYWLFSVIHDGAHRAISSNSIVNEGLGGLGLIFLFPYAPMTILRWVHNQHHVHANGADDPDLFEHQAKPWQIPFKWTFFDGYYIYYFFKHGGKLFKKHAVSIISYYFVLICVVAFLLNQGLGYELFWLWFIPSRIALFLIAVVFVILPHHPAMVSQQDDAYLATTMRMGWEWLLTPLLVYQNYHLIHHLYPTVPFYKMHRVWYLKYDELNQHNVSFQNAFALEPENIELHRNFYSQPAV